VLHGSIHIPRARQRLVDAAVVEHDAVQTVPQCRFFAVLHLAIPGARLWFLAHSPGRDRDIRVTPSRLFECKPLATRSCCPDIVRYLRLGDFACFPVVYYALNLLNTRIRVPWLRIFGMFSILQSSAPIISILSQTQRSSKLNRNTVIQTHSFRYSKCTTHVKLKRRREGERAASSVCFISAKAAQPTRRRPGRSPVHPLLEDQHLRGSLEFASAAHTHQGRPSAVGCWPCCAGSAYVKSPES